MATTRGLGHQLARSLPDARAIAEELTARVSEAEPRRFGVRPHRSGWRLLSNVLTMVAECEADLARMKTREGMKVARHHRSAAGQAAHGQPEATNPPRGPARGGAAHDQRGGGAVLPRPLDGVPGVRPGPLPRGVLTR